MSGVAVIVWTQTRLIQGKTMITDVMKYHPLKHIDLESHVLKCYFVSRLTT